MEVTLTPEGIRDRRVAVGMSHAEVAVALGVNARTIERWEQGSRRPSKPDLIALEAVFAEQAGAKSSSRPARKSQKR
jgi:DNA-binding transcriptional regulator YiaG